MMLYRSPIALDQIAQPDGLLRGRAAVPKEGEIVHLGVVSPNGDIAFTTMAKDRPIDKASGLPIPYTADELYEVEMLFVMPGMSFPDTGYQYRSSVQTPQGVMYIFQKLPEDGPPRRNLIVVGKGH